MRISKADRPIGRLPRVAALGGVLFAALAASPPPGPAPLSLTLKAEKLTAAAGSPLPAFETLELAFRGGGRYAPRLLPEASPLALPELDLRLLVPRIPRLARGNADLTRIALIQREFNRNEVHNDLGGGLDFSVANNCLRQSLWEVKLARKENDRTTMLYHAWFDFPRDEYARLFREVNGVALDDYEKLFVTYPSLGGLPVPLDDLRRVLQETVIAPIDTHGRDILQRLTEQQAKTKFLLTPAIDSYGDFVAPAKQPVVTARFSDPGFYNPSDPMRFDLAWLASPERTVWRRVKSPKSDRTFPEIEVRFANGNRILLADSRLEELEPRSEAPTREAEVLKLVCGIGTPDIHASAAERARELSEDRPRYLMLLDANGKHMDNHFTGMDGLYAWRLAGDPGELHLWLVGYERIALVAHLSAPWPFLKR